MTIDRSSFGAVLDRYSDDLVAEIRSDYDRYGLDLSFVPFVLDDDIADLVPADMSVDRDVYGFILGYVSARVASAFASN